MNWITRVEVAMITGALFCIGGCTSLPAPKLIYTNAKHPLSDTSIVTCGLVEHFDCMVTDVDGASIRNILGGGRRWIRVLPGRHTIGFSAFSNGKGGWAQVEVTTQPRHVYEVHITNMDSGLSFRPSVVDFGEQSAYDIHENGPKSRVIGVASFH